jgi:hypothetical protein
MEKPEIVRTLRDIGFPITQDASAKQIHEVVRDFQRGFTFGKALIQDGYVGKKTADALKYCLKKDGRCSTHFKFIEFTSKGSQDYTIKVAAALVLGLEELRGEFGAIPILSGYRDPEHNENVGSMSNSQHLFGNAIDPVPDLPLPLVLRVKRFSGIGTRGHLNGGVRHIDVRHIGPNTTGSSIERPARWVYA